MSTDEITKRARLIARRLAKEYPDAVCALDFKNPYELLVATILAAQSTDVRVNMVTPALFKKYPTPQKLAAANPDDVEELVKSTGFFRNKTKSIIGMARTLVDDFGGVVPHGMEDLVKLPGVGRKTANVIRSVALGETGLPVDTHVTRLSRRLGLVDTTDAVKIETALNAMLPESEWGMFSLRLIDHGRKVCDAKKPKCAECVLVDLCPSAHSS